MPANGRNLSSPAVSRSLNKELLPMIHELKRYDATPGKGWALRERFAKLTMPLLKRHGITVLHCWEPEGEPDSFVYLVSFADASASDAAWKAFAADPEWKAGKAASEIDGPLLASQGTTLLKPSYFSPGG